MFIHCINYSNYFRSPVCALTALASFARQADKTPDYWGLEDRAHYLILVNTMLDCGHILKDSENRGPETSPIFLTTLPQKSLSNIRAIVFQHKLRPLFPSWLAWGRHLPHFRKQLGKSASSSYCRVTKQRSVGPESDPLGSNSLSTICWAS